MGGAAAEMDELAFPLRESADANGGSGGQGSSSGWVDVAPLPGALVVNTGDMMQRYTNGLYQSNLHRGAHPEIRRASQLSPNPESAYLREGERPWGCPISLPTI